MTTTAPPPVATALRAWAYESSSTTQAAVELLLRALGGRFAKYGYPWVVRDGDRAYLDFDAIEDNIGPLSSGEKRVLRLVASLGGGTAVALGDALSGLDRAAAGAALAAFAHATGFRTLARWPE